jgi:hypothetical protein
MIASINNTKKRNDDDCVKQDLKTIKNICNSSGSRQPAKTKKSMLMMKNTELGTTNETATPPPPILRPFTERFVHP